MFDIACPVNILEFIAALYCSRLMLVENLRREDKDLEILLIHDMRRQACFADGLLQKRFRIPSVLGRYLGKKEPAMAAEFDDEPVSSDLDLPG